MTERLRKFFRIRGKTGFVLDEVVAPVVLVQDLTVGPYQAGVSPAGGVVDIIIPSATQFGNMALALNDKLGSLTPKLDAQFDNRSFTVNWAEMQNTSVDEVPIVEVRLGKRSDLVLEVPASSAALFDLQNNNGELRVPVEMFTFANTVPGVSASIWKGILGDNTSTLGSRRTFDPFPPVTIGPEDVMLIFFQSTPSLIDITVVLNVRGFYQEQPA